MVMTHQAEGKKTAFAKYPSTKKLEKLAEDPVDLTKKGVLTPERLEKHLIEGCGFKLFFGTQRVDDEVLKALFSLEKDAKAVEKMIAQQSGAVINLIEGHESEHRSVLHTAMRDFFDNPHDAKVAKEASELERKELEKLKEFLGKIDHEDRFDDIVVIGIGGSNLGQESVYLALKHLKKSKRNAHYISNIDPDQITDVLNSVDLKRTLFVAVSKSGSTLETVTNEAFVRERLKEEGIESNEHFVAVTGEGSPMDDPEKYLECFYSWDFIGGRYSTTAMYGAVALSFMIGYDNFWEFLRGANAMDKMALNPEPMENLPLMMALLGIWNHNFLGCPNVAVIPYSDALHRFPAHIQQVDMESNGKHIDRHGTHVNFKTGPVIFGEPGTNAQHSFYQLLHQGTEVVPMELIGFVESQYGEDQTLFGTTNQEKLVSNLVAQAIALGQGQQSDNPNKTFEGNRPSTVLIAERLTPYAMGALFALYEHKVAFQGFIWDINSFDQEGVQLGKVLANKVIESFKEKRQKGSFQGSFPLGESFLNNLEF